MDPRKRTRPKPAIIDTCLFVGGIADGQGHRIDMTQSQAQFSATPTGGVVVYQREIIAGENAAFAFWREESLSIDEALKCLFERYKGANRDG